MAYAALGKDTERASFNTYNDTHAGTGPSRDLTSFEREALDRVPHATNAVVIPIYSLIPLTVSQIEKILKDVQEPEYAEPTGMKFKIIRWKGKDDLDDRELEVEMLKVAKRKGKGLLVFVDEATVVGEGVRISDFEIWDDGWGEEKAVGGLKGEGLKWGRVSCGDLLRVYMDVEVGQLELERAVVGGRKAIKIIRWGRLEVF